jgi:hypothetical protein
MAMYKEKLEEFLLSMHLNPKSRSYKSEIFSFQNIASVLQC